jgi:hypothetical protein
MLKDGNGRFLTLANHRAVATHIAKYEKTA